VTPEERIQAALDIASSYGGIDGAHHKMWVIDQMVRVLTGCPEVKLLATDIHGTSYTYDALGQSDTYRAWVKAFEEEDGVKIYEWEIGIIP